MAEDTDVSSLKSFHPAIAAWFTRSLGAPTEVQARAWESIRGGSHTLIAAPTGSGKTLAAFLTILNDLLVEAWNGELAPQTHVVYVSPLKALSNDVEKNLSRPLREIQDDIFQTHLRKIDIRTAVRTGDTPAYERAAMVKTPPHILITTPESLFLLLTSKSGRDMLRHTRKVIVDEIHALVAEKRGAHLALSLERLQALVGEASGGRELLRIGLSATQKPIEEVARFLIGNRPAQGNSDVTPCAIIDAGHKRRLDLQVEIPASPLTAVMAAEVWEEVYARIEGLILAHKTTLLFVNTRRLAERVAHRLSQTLGEDKVAAHHGSLSKDRRFDAEQRLKSGALQCLVATASLELGIDIGSVDLVIQIGCPKSISALLQRVGRSGHAVGGMPKGRLFPLTRDELAEAAALLDAVRRGELDALSIPAKPLDILAQQIVAEVACREWTGEELYALYRRAYPYRDLTVEEFREITDMLSQGFTTRRGRRGAHVHYDGVNDRLRGRPGARLTALTNGGAIPDTFDYDVKLEPGNTLLGSVNEDFAIESIPGDIFQLGNNSWRIVRIEGSTVRVADAHGQPPSLPFWLGEAPGRSEAFSVSVSRLRGEIDARLGVTSVLQSRVEDEGSAPGAPWKREAMAWLCGELGLGEAAAEQLVDYLAAAKLSLGVMPSRETLVLERFFDDAGDMHLVVHSPFGSRMNRAWGLSLRKRFCRKFNFELQAAATEDCIILSLGATHSFPLEEVYQYLKAGSVRPILVQALLDAPMFEVRWRWNATRALALIRNRNGKKVPAQLQRMAAEDLVSLVFPDQRACFENIQGEREIPDHPLVRQTISDCLHEAMDIDGLERLLADIEAGRLRLEARDLKEPSPLAQEVINARPYAFLDDAPLEERRTRAIQSRRWLDPAEAGDLSRLDPQAIAAVRAEAWPLARNPDELHDALMLTGYLTTAEIARGEAAPLGNPYVTSEAPRSDDDAAEAAGAEAAEGAGWTSHLEALKADNRAACLRAVPGGPAVWVAAERLPQALAALPGASLLFTPRTRAGGLPSAQPGAEPPSEEEALVEILRGRLEALGPLRNLDISVTLGLPMSRVDAALLALEQEGFVLRGRFSERPAAAAPAGPAGSPFAELEWCERRLLARIHRYTLARLHREIEPVSAADYIRFLFHWQGIDGDRDGAPQPAGPEALEPILSALEGYEAPCSAWESEILPARMRGYEPAWLDLQCLSGQFIWGRLRPVALGLESREAPSSLPANDPPRISAPVKATPIAFLARENLGLWLADRNADTASDRAAALRERIASLRGSAAAVLEYLRLRGASFWREILRDSGLSKDAVREGIAELVSLGLLTSDGFRGLRALLRAPEGLEKSGRWSLLHAQPDPETESPAPIARGASAVSGTETYARILLRRYGVVFRKLADRENVPPWRDLVRAFRLLEARGEIRGGRFVEGFYGEQFALPESVALLRKLRRRENDGAQGRVISLSAADPANLQGLLTPGPRIPALRRNRVLFRDGFPIAAMEGGEFRLLDESAAQRRNEWEHLLRAGKSDSEKTASIAIAATAVS